MAVLKKMLVLVVLLAGCARAGSTADVAPVATLEPATDAAPSIEFDATPTKISTGMYSVLIWHASNVESCKPSGAWSGPESTDGSMHFDATTVGEFDFVLTCTAGGETLRKIAHVSVVSRITAWGDSLTAGDGGNGYPYGYFLGKLLERPVENMGVGGQASGSIVARQGSVPALLSFANGRIDGKQPSAVSSASVSPISAQGPGPITGTVAGIHGTLSLDQGGLVFTRDVAGDAHVQGGPEAFRPDTDEFRDRITVFWMGRNNFRDPGRVLADLSAAVRYLRTDRYVILSIPNGTGEGRGSDAYAQITSLNASIASRFAGHYIDVRKELVAAADPGDAKDVSDRNSDIVPTSLRADNIHLTAKGYEIVGARVAKFMTEKGWV